MDNSWLYNRNLDYEHDFSFLNIGEQFPTMRMQYKNADYRFRKKQFSGKYAQNRMLLTLVQGTEREIPYRQIGLNYYKLLTNKIIDLIFNNEIIIKTGNKDNDNALNKVVEKTSWIKNIRKAVKYVTIYGDSCIKTYKEGASVFSPDKAFKVVAANDSNTVLAYVLWQPIKVKEFGEYKYKYIRFEIHTKGMIYELVKEYQGGFNCGNLGRAVEYEYNGRKIKSEGNWYTTPVPDLEMVQWLTINETPDAVYGESLYTDIQDIVTCIEQRISMEHHALNSLSDPLLIVGMSSIVECEDGSFKLKTVNDGKMLVTEDRNNDKSIIPQSFQQDFKLDTYSDFVDQLKSELYELSELGRVYLSSEYSGNISEESISNLIKGAIDKANRILTDVYDSIRDSLYVLARCNDIEVEKSDLLINFGIGQTDNDKNIADVCQILSTNKILSKQTLREKYFGYSEEQSIQEEQQILKEDAGLNSSLLQNNDIENQVDNLVDDIDENSNL